MSLLSSYFNFKKRDQEFKFNCFDEIKCKITGRQGIIFQPWIKLDDRVRPSPIYWKVRFYGNIVPEECKQDNLIKLEEKEMLSRRDEELIRCYENKTIVKNKLSGREGIIRIMDHYRSSIPPYTDYVLQYENGDRVLCKEKDILIAPQVGDRVKTEFGKGIVRARNAASELLEATYSVLLDNGNGALVPCRTTRKLRKNKVEFKEGDRIFLNGHGKGTVMGVGLDLPGKLQGLKVNFDDHGLGLCPATSVKKLRKKIKVFAVGDRVLNKDTGRHFHLMPYDFDPIFDSKLIGREEYRQKYWVKLRKKLMQYKVGDRLRDRSNLLAVYEITYIANKIANLSNESTTIGMYFSDINNHYIKLKPKKTCEKSDSLQKANVEIEELKNTLSLRTEALSEARVKFINAQQEIVSLKNINSRLGEENNLLRNTPAHVQIREQNASEKSEVHRQYHHLVLAYNQLGAKIHNLRAAFDVKNSLLNNADAKIKELKIIQQEQANEIRQLKEEVALKCDKCNQSVEKDLLNDIEKLKNDLFSERVRLSIRRAEYELLEAENSGLKTSLGKALTALHAEPLNP